MWGVAYRIAHGHVAEVKEYLVIREINGYTIHYVPFNVAPDDDPMLLLLPPSGEHRTRRDGEMATVVPSATSTINTLVYIGTPDNEQFIGPQDPQQLAEHIYLSEGPSGPNRDYLWELERALMDVSRGSEDEHVSDLSSRARAFAIREGNDGTRQDMAEGRVMSVSGPELGKPGCRPNPENAAAASVGGSEETEKVC